MTHKWHNTVRKRQNLVIKKGDHMRKQHIVNWKHATHTDKFPKADKTIHIISILSTIGDRAFSVAASWLWNTLPLQNVTSASSLIVLTKRMKTHYFSRSLTNLLWHFVISETIIDLLTYLICLERHYTHLTLQDRPFRRPKNTQTVH